MIKIILLNCQNVCIYMHIIYNVDVAECGVQCF